LHFTHAGDHGDVPVPPVDEERAEREERLREQRGDACESGLVEQLTEIVDDRSAIATLSTHSQAGDTTI
jgi:hypothetical protein